MQTQQFNAFTTKDLSGRAEKRESAKSILCECSNQKKEGHLDGVAVALAYIECIVFNDVV